MWLVLADTTDAVALWAHAGLRARGLEPVELVSSEDLAQAVWEHRVGARGVDFRFALSDGREFGRQVVRGVLNRLVEIPPESFVLVQPSEREYVRQELTAFYMSWLLAVRGPVMNRPTAQGLCGRIRHISEWVWLASRAGLPLARYGQSSHKTPPQYSFHARLPDVDGGPLTTVLVIGGQVVGAPTPEIRQGCAQLAELAHAPLLGVEFSTAGPQAWSVAGTTTLPDLRAGGEEALEALARALTRAPEDWP